MSNQVLEKVINCPNLPSLPAVAMEVLDLTRDPDVPLKEIATVVERDQGLASKILRTVNSSFYGLSQPCPTIGRALGYLGLSTVKTLVLSFSVVEAHKVSPAATFDIDEYWRRVLYTAVAARKISLATKIADPDEAFISGLLEDVGMLAMHVALRDEYGVVVNEVAEHDDLSAAETKAFTISHADAGAALTEKWRLPPLITDCIKYHHAPDDATGDNRMIVQLVAGAGMFATAMLSDAPGERIRDAIAFLSERLNLDAGKADDLISSINEGAKELSGTFDIDTGSTPDTEELRAAASDLLLQHQAEVARETNELALQTITDGLTGVWNRKRFDELLEAELACARDKGEPLSVWFIDADRFKSVNDTLGHQAGDIVLVELARRLRDSVGSAGEVCRYGGEEFAVILPRHDGRAAFDLADATREHVAATAFDISAAKCGVDEKTVTVSVGVACFDPSTPGELNESERLVQAADECVYKAKQGGRNRVVLHGAEEPAPAAEETPEPEAAPMPDAAAAPDPAPPPPPPPPRPPADARAASEPKASISSDPVVGHVGTGGTRIMIVEDDPLAAELLRLCIGRVQPESHRVMCSSYAEASALLRSEGPFDLVLTSSALSDGTGVEVVRSVRGDAAHAGAPVVIMTISDDAQTRANCMASGANAIVSKRDISRDARAWITNILEMWKPIRVAA